MKVNIFVLNLLLQKCSFLPEKFIMEKLENNRLLIVDTFPISNYPSQLSTYSFRVQTQRNHIYSQKIRNRLGRPTFHSTSTTRPSRLRGWSRITWRRSPGRNPGRKCLESSSWTATGQVICSWTVTGQVILSGFEFSPHVSGPYAYIVRTNKRILHHSIWKWPKNA